MHFSPTFSISMCDLHFTIIIFYVVFPIIENEIMSGSTTVLDG